MKNGIRKNVPIVNLYQDGQIQDLDKGMSEDHSTPATRSSKTR